MIRINLLGADSAKKSKGLRAIRLPEFSVGAVQAGIAGMFVVVLLGIGFAWWSQSGTLKRMRTELALVQSERARVQEVADQVDALQNRTDLLRQKLEVIVELKANQTGPVMLLDEISRLVTDGLCLAKLDLASGDVTLRGAALSDNPVADFLTNLQASRYFEQVRLRTMGNSGETVSFQITLVFKANNVSSVQEPTIPAVGGGG